MPDETKTITFVNNFNISTFRLTGIPGTTALLSLSCDAIKIRDKDNKLVDYMILLEVELRPCIRGEIYIPIVDNSNFKSSQFYECHKCDVGYNFKIY